MRRFGEKAVGVACGSRGRRSRNRPVLESLERRELLTTGSQPYLLTGNRWSNATPITFSVAADGVTWDRKANVLNATMDARFATDAWQREVARALQTWASVADINFVRVADSGLAFDAVGMAQGDARFGDIRFGGYDFDDASRLAHAYTPPPNGNTGAGDVALNTAMSFDIGGDFDLYSVLLHETGHSLGLEHLDNPDAVMTENYGGARAGLEAGDIAGIRAIYGARIDDVYGQQGLGSGLSDAVDVSAGRVTPTQFALGNLSLTASGDSDYFSVVAPASGASLHVMAIAAGVSLLGAQVSLYDASGALLDREGDASSYGLNVTASAAGVVAGQRYYIKVSGATDDVFAVGSYGLQVDFAGLMPLDAETSSPVVVAAGGAAVVEPVSPPASAVASHTISPPSDPVPPPSVPAPPSLAPPAAPPAPPPLTPPATQPGQPVSPVVVAAEGAAVVEPVPPPASAVASHTLPPPSVPVPPSLAPPSFDQPATSHPNLDRPRWRRRRPRFPGEHLALPRRMHHIRGQLGRPR